MIQRGPDDASDFKDRLGLRRSCRNNSVFKPPAVMGDIPGSADPFFYSYLPGYGLIQYLIELLVMHDSKVIT